MARFLAFLAAFLLVLLGRPPQAAAEAQRFWDLSPHHLRLLLASPQVMVTRTALGCDAYCRCPVVLRPDEIPSTDEGGDRRGRGQALLRPWRRRFHHPRFGAQGRVRPRRQHDPDAAPQEPRVPRSRASPTCSAASNARAPSYGTPGNFDEAVGKEELLAAYLNQIEFGGRDIVGLYRAARHYFRKEPKDLTLYESRPAGRHGAGPCPPQPAAGSDPRARPRARRPRPQADGRAGQDHSRSSGDVPEGRDRAPASCRSSRSSRRPSPNGSSRTGRQARRESARRSGSSSRLIHASSTWRRITSASSSGPGASARVRRRAS